MDDENGWMKEKKDLDPIQFFQNHGFDWVRRGSRGKIGNLRELRLIPVSDKYEGLNRQQVQFIFRKVLHEGNFDSYIRSLFYLLEYVKDNDLINYLIAIESGMGNYERLFSFYLLTTQYELRGQKELKECLIEKNFLFYLKEVELLDPLHKSLLYPKDGYPPVS